LLFANVQCFLTRIYPWSLWFKPWSYGFSPCHRQILLQQWNLAVWLLLLLPN